jgi:hypothetical protein
VTVIVKEPDVENVQESVEVPAPVTLVGVRAQAVLSAERLTTPLKPLTAASVIVDVPSWFTFTLTVVGLALIVKSCTVNETVAVCERLPLVPVTITVTLPVDVKVHDRVWAKLRSAHAVLSADRFTVPLKPLRAEIVIDESPAWLTSTLTLDGLAVIVKSCTVKLTVAW